MAASDANLGSGPDLKPWDVDDLPVLDEPFAVEFANTSYRTDREDLDVLAGAEATALWFQHDPAAAGLDLPQPVAPSMLVALRMIRDAIRGMLVSAADDTGADDADAVETLNRAARRAPAHLVLVVGDRGAPLWRLHHQGGADESLIAGVAGRCILFLAGDDLARVRRCDAPDCPMLFVRRHRGRRFCHESCAHRTRQARYYRSLSTARPVPAHREPVVADRDRPGANAYRTVGRVR